MRHSNQLPRIPAHGTRAFDLLDVYVGPGGVLTGSSRLSQEAQEKAIALARQQEAERTERVRRRKREALDVRIAALRKEFEIEEDESGRLAAQESAIEKLIIEDRQVMARSRQADKGELLKKKSRNLA